MKIRAMKGHMDSYRKKLFCPNNEIMATINDLVSEHMQMLRSKSPKRNA